ncbi:sensor histidine kinase [Saliterribacillus persicus]|uniref:histidine kinase n=1 Tax=Saliterribacillus persicus TaxID=930114 RepID=A0A368Y9E8_9BACI|nr:sensor histidine kinase [Saliterribacillus persicus]RCW74814.1 two-component system sensor histidine kinase YesM [Saliterribacillus persicus]
MWARIRRLTSPSFRLKVFLSSLICIGLPVIFSLTFYSYLTRDAVEEQAIQNAKKELDLTEENVSRILEDMMNASNFVQIDSELNTILKNKANLSIEGSNEESYSEYIEDRQVRKTIENITLLGEKSHITILLKNGKYYANYSTAQYDPNSLYQKKWFNELKSLNGFESYWSGAEETVFSYEKYLNPYQLSVGRTLRDSNQGIYGYVVVTLLESKISNILDNQKPQEQTMIIDENNTILSHRNSEYVNQPASFSDDINLSKSSQIARWDNQQYVVTSKELTTNNWKLVSIIPYKAATSNINAIFSKVFVLLAISFAIFFVILAYLINRITRPLRYLDRVVKKVQTGDLSIRSNVKSKDEIGDFSQSLNHMLDRVNVMIEEVNDTHKRKRKAELAMLQAQINPHFLFNVLNSIRMKVLRFGDKDSASMIQSLSKLLRWTIDYKEDKITFFDEISLVKDYVNVMNMRQKEKVELDIDISSQVYKQLVPRFLLQPLIENSIIHGLNQSAGNIRINGKMEKDNFQIMIEDNGVGIGKEKLHELNQWIHHSGTNERSHNGFSSIGMTNVFERLQLSYQEKPQMKIDSTSGKGTTITITIPLGGEDYVQSYVG